MNALRHHLNVHTATQFRKVRGRAFSHAQAPPSRPASPVHVLRVRCARVFRALCESNLLVIEKFIFWTPPLCSPPCGFGRRRNCWQSWRPQTPTPALQQGLPTRARIVQRNRVTTPQTHTRTGNPCLEKGARRHHLNPRALSSRRPPRKAKEITTVSAARVSTPKRVQVSTPQGARALREGRLVSGARRGRRQ